MRTLARCYAIPGRITQNYSLVFNGWLFENYDDAKTAILGEILDAFKEEASTSQSVKKVFKALYKSVDKLKLAKSAVKYGLDFFLTGGISSLTSLTINKALETVSGKVPDADLSGIEDAIRDELDYKELREDIREFQKSFAELLEESKISRLVVFIDELDRCRPDTILDTLEVVKLFLFTGNAAFVELFNVSLNYCISANLSNEGQCRMQILKHIVFTRQFSATMSPVITHIHHFTNHFAL
jgi:predicted KAP-like P-loop ATPase